MKKRGGKSSTDLLELAEQEVKPAEPTPVASLPTVLEYKPYTATDPWRVQLFELFQAEFDLPQPYDKSMAMFHEIAEAQARGFMIVKRLYGITPVILPASADPKEMEPATREEIGEKLGIDKEQLQAELNALRGWYHATLAAKPPPVEEPQASPAAQRGELEFDETKFKDFGFSETIFDVSRKDPTTKEDRPRSGEERKTERNWFIKRVCEWGKMLEEPMVSTLVRQALMNELYLRRLETEISLVMPGTDGFSKLQRVKNDIETTYQKQLEEIKLNFPELNVAGKTTFRGALSDLKDAYLEYKKDGSTKLVDRMRTAFEIEVETRQSEQSPTPQYRVGLNIFWIEAMHGLYDPAWRSQIPQRVLKKMDAAGRAAIDAARAEMNEPLVDLERGVAPGEGSQYPDLVVEKKAK